MDHILNISFLVGASGFERTVVRSLLVLTLIHSTAMAAEQVVAMLEKESLQTLREAAKQVRDKKKEEAQEEKKRKAEAKEREEQLTAVKELCKAMSGGGWQRRLRRGRRGRR